MKGTITLGVSAAVVIGLLGVLQPAYAAADGKKDMTGEMMNRHRAMIERMPKMMRAMKTKPETVSVPEVNYNDIFKNEIMPAFEEYRNGMAKVGRTGQPGFNLTISLPEADAE